MDGNQPAGSGFLLGVKEDNATFCYFVTARHVVEPFLFSGRKILNLRFNRKNDKGGEIIPFSTDSYNGKQWLEHKNQAVDLAIVPLSIYGKKEEPDLEWAMYIVDNPTNDYLATKEFIKKYNIKQGDRVFTAGLVPYLYNKDEKNLVLSRFGTISFLEQKEINFPPPLNWGAQKIYFVDCPAFGGNSGGPAYVILERAEDSSVTFGWRIALLGIVTDFIPSPLRGGQITLQEKKQQPILVPFENTGISKIIPVDYLVDILFSDSLKESRKQAAQNLKKSIGSGNEQGNDKIPSK